jgi:hypothetical protein
VVGVAVSAEGWFSDTASFNLNNSLQVANGATEEATADLRNQVGRADDHSGDGDELINV